MSLLNRKSFPSGPFSVFFTRRRRFTLKNFFISAELQLKRRGKGWKLAKNVWTENFRRTEPGTEAPEQQKTGSLLLRRCRNFNQIEKKNFGKGQKTERTQSDPWFQKFRLVLAPIALSKLATWLLIRLVSHLSPFFSARQHGWASKAFLRFQAWTFARSSNLFLMSFHPPLLTIQSLLHPGFEPLIFCFSYVYH